MTSELCTKLAVYNAAATACVTCVAHGVLHEGEAKRARPLVCRNPTGALGIVIVGEAPNYDDTFDPLKGYLTYEAETDPTGRFMRALLMDEAGLTASEIDDVLFTNAVLCLPRKRGDKFPVTAGQLRRCSYWLRRLIDDSAATAVVTMGAAALRATRLIDAHRLELNTAAGKLHRWYGRLLLPLYHAGRLGRLARSEAKQREDMRALRVHLGRT